VVHYATMAPRDHAGMPRAPRRARFAPGRVSVAYLILLVAAVLLLGNAIAGESGFLTMRQARQQYEDLARSVAALREENARLREEIRRLNNDPAAVEEIARRELGLVRPGEKVFIVRDVPKR
jgi:cell division protein FtsB